LGVNFDGGTFLHGINKAHFGAAGNSADSLSSFPFRVFRVFRGSAILISKRTIKKSKLAAALLDWFAANARDLPWRRTRDPYAVWVSEIMLQQTQVKTVVPFWERWLRELPTLQAAAQAGPDTLHKLWEGLGYYTRVRNLQAAAQLIVREHGGAFPRRFDEVLALPGIGRYTAGAICSIAFNQPTPILDGNVIRVLTRVYGIATNPKEKETNQELWGLAEELVVEASHSKRRDKTTAGNCSALNQSLMELGALICTPRNAQCPICPVNKLCVALKQNRVGELPNLGERAPATARRYMAFILERGGRFLVRQRPAGVVNAHLWEFPNVEVNGDNPGAERLFRAECGLAPKNSPFKISPFITVKHSITRYRITLEAFRVHVAAGRPVLNGAVWKTPRQMHKLAFTGAHRKIADAAATDESNAGRARHSVRAEGRR
jgi:A/G-specific adenine glycosylase